jgi:hypothetical protein
MCLFDLRLSQSLRPLVINAPDLPDSLDAIEALAHENTSGSGYTLAQRLWAEYKASSDLSWVLWDNVIECIKNLPDFSGDKIAQQAYIHRYADFLDGVARHSPTDIDLDIEQWLQDVDYEEWAAFQPMSLHVLAILFKELISRKVVCCSTVFTGFLCSMWKAAGDGYLGDLNPKLESCNFLARYIFFCPAGEANSLPLDELRHLAWQRTELLRGTQLERLADVLPSLIKLEYDTTIEISTRAAIAALRECITSSNIFKRAIVRDMDKYCAVFIGALERDGTDPMTSSQIARAGKLAIQLAPSKQSFALWLFLAITLIVRFFAVQRFRHRRKCGRLLFSLSL